MEVAEEMNNLGCVLHSPPLISVIRVNLLNISLQDATVRLQAMLDCGVNKRQNKVSYIVQQHPILPDVLVIPGKGPDLGIEPELKQIYVDLKCGSAVMRGADVFAPGVLGSSRAFSAKEKVSLWMDTSSTIRRGCKTLFEGGKLFLGNGQTTRSRDEIFAVVEKMSNPIGVAVELTDPVWSNPPMGSVLENWGFVQNLPSILASHVLDPQVGETILDMCAAPGGKATHIGSLMKNQGRLVCLDKGPGRGAKIMRLALELELTNVELHSFYDSSKACDPDLKPGLSPSAPPFAPESFDRIILDAPCSGSGNRPLIQKRPTEKHVKSHEIVQWRLLKTAAKLLKKGGILVYSTCSLRVEENEFQVERFLDTFTDEFVLVEAPELVINNFSRFCSTLWLNAPKRHGNCVFRFDPRSQCALHKNVLECSNDHFGFANLDNFKIEHNYFRENCESDFDTIGFFIARFRKL